jgi:hypothetical protein
VPCTSQQLPNLAASAAPPAAQARTITARAASGPKVTKLVHRIDKALGR